MRKRTVPGTVRFYMRLRGKKEAPGARFYENVRLSGNEYNFLPVLQATIYKVHN